MWYNPLTWFADDTTPAPVSNAPTAGNNPVGGVAPGASSVNTEPSFFDFLWATVKGEPAALDSWAEATEMRVEQVKAIPGAIADKAASIWSGIKTFIIWSAVIAIIVLLAYYYLRAKATKLGSE